MISIRAGRGAARGPKNRQNNIRGERGNYKLDRGKTNEGEVLQMLQKGKRQYREGNKYGYK